MSKAHICIDSKSDFTFIAQDSIIITHYGMEIDITGHFKSNTRTNNELKTQEILKDFQAEEIDL